MRRGSWWVVGLIALCPATALAVPTPAAAAATECPGSYVEIANGDFEEPVVRTDFPTTTDASNVPGWLTTAPDNDIEIWPSGYNDVPAASGVQFAEMNANFPSTLVQTLDTVPGTEMTYVVHHRGRAGTDVGNVAFGPAGGAPNHVVEMTDGRDAWGLYVGSYVIPPGQTRTTFGFEAVSTGNGDTSTGNFLDGIQFGTAGCLTVAKTASDLNGNPVDQVQVGDLVQYTVEIANPGGAAIAGPQVSDTIPAALAYEPDSIELLDGPRPGPRTDADDGDGFTVTGGLLNVDLATGGPTTIPAGGSARFTFRARVLPAAAESSVTNVVTVDYLEPRLGAARVAVSDDATIVVLPAPTPTPTPTGPAPTPAEPVPAPSTPLAPTSAPTVAPDAGASGGPTALAASGTGIPWVLAGLAAVLLGLGLAVRRRAERSP